MLFYWCIMILSDYYGLKTQGKFNIWVQIKFKYWFSSILWPDISTQVYHCSDLNSEFSPGETKNLSPELCRDHYCPKYSNFWNNDKSCQNLNQISEI